MSRFLVIRLSSIGDIVHALPAVAALRDSGAEIDWAVESRFATLLAGNNCIRRVIALDTLSFSNGVRFAVAAENLVRGVASLRASEYDAAIDFQGLVKSAFVARLSRTRDRVGFSEYWLREPLAGVFYTDKVNLPRDTGRHIIERNLALAERLGARIPSRREEWRFPLPRSDREEHTVRTRLESIQIRDFIILNPGGGWQAKRWPPNGYAELIRRFGTKFSGHFLLTGSQEEVPQIETILRRARSNRAQYFPSTLLEFIALARRARLMVSGDTGPMHLAAAVGTPLVAIFSDRDPLNTAERNGPFSPHDIVILPDPTLSSGQQVNGANFLGGVGVESVLSAMSARLAARRVPSR